MDLPLESDGGVGSQGNFLELRPERSPFYRAFFVDQRMEIKHAIRWGRRARCAIYLGDSVRNFVPENQLAIS